FLHESRGGFPCSKSMEPRRGRPQPTKSMVFFLAKSKFNFEPEVNKQTAMGIFFGVCIHRVCYGFHIMKEPEGRKDLFYVLMRYWPKENLDNLTVLYDFYCQTDEYLLNRYELSIILESLSIISS